MEVIELIDDEAGDWLAQQAGPATVHVRDARLHLLIGDSIARRSALRSRSPTDQILNRARGGATWTSLLDNLTSDIHAWQVAAAASGARTGTAIIWENGNELYSRYTRAPSFSEEDLQAVVRFAKRVINQLLEQAENVVILGPLPRPQGELLGTEWSHTAAYRLERTLLTLADGDPSQGGRPGTPTDSPHGSSGPGDLGGGAVVHRWRPPLPERIHQGRGRHHLPIMAAARVDP